MFANGLGLGGNVWDWDGLVSSSLLFSGGDR